MENRYDVVVIGGGIHGVGVAQATAAAGYSVALMEARDLAWGTSSRSSKLIHGGLRYLESGQFSVVRECLRERALLLQLAPSLVKLTPFYIPIYRDTSRRPWKIRSGLALYGVLAGFSKGAGFRKVPRSEWGGLDGLQLDGLDAVFQYWDAQTDDAALTRAVMASAKTLGADYYQSAQFLSAELDNNQAQLEFEYQQSKHRVSCQVVVNAGGPWVNHILQRVIPQTLTNAVDLVQGTHMVLDTHLQQGIYYMESPQDQRAIFAMPWQGKMLLGTTESLYKGDPAEVKPLASERDYLLETLAHYFPHYRNNMPDELSSFAGLRVLPKDDGSAFARSRETMLLWNNLDNKKVLSIYGGKLTAYRATAERVVSQLKTVLPAIKPIANVNKLALSPV